ncbi:MAG: PIG-L family deacetylase [Candidatus Jettenia sp.]|nr:MAG: PIG-L family deacetylase [Candidatus Jettenia sp.]
MRKTSSKSLIHSLYRHVMNSVMIEQDEHELKRPAVVFSPHPDDETLGCGGTIIRKKRAGADVHIVFMTDGSQSHRQFISESVLKSIRRREAIEATRMLGVGQDNVTFLEFDDKKLWENRTIATDKVIDILLHHKPDKVFIPYYRETPPDHWATNKIVAAALRKIKKETMIYEYPIWFWNHWPWVTVPMSLRLKTIRTLRSIPFANLHLLLDFRSSVDIGDTLEVKRAALHEYKSQMTRLIPDKKWPTLNDVSQGKFLNCFFQPREIFYRYCM